MSKVYRIFGSELSPYSVKIRSYFRFKGLPHEWLIRNPGNIETYKKHARIPIIPLVLTPGGEALQDSTPIIEKIEQRVPAPPVQPADAALAFLSALIEEYADEWVNKPMFHYRWTYPPDQLRTARRIAEDHLGATGEAVDQVAEKVRQRMIPRLSFVGSSPETLPVIEASLRRILHILEAHLAGHDYLFGSRPALADFGLFAQLHQCACDPTPGGLKRDIAPTTLAWIDRMLDPGATGAYAAWPDLAQTLTPLLTDEIGGVFLPWSVANARAIADGQDRFSVAMGDGAFSQEPQKYHARSLGVLREKLAVLSENAALAAILQSTGCRQYLL